VAADFDSEENFRALRLDPYLITTARRHPTVAPYLTELAERTAATRIALVHGDVSPKNILVGPNGPVLLDAECAWYGDPAFDLAFCLNHLLLKCIVRPDRQEALMASFAALAEAYLAQVDWEAPSALEARAAQLLPALLLARVDGKSPVEYLTQETDRVRVRNAALAMLQAPAQELAAIGAAWRRALAESLPPPDRHVSISPRSR
jgi:aminoglycoside phosphotransferase (APT) family kinase protein